MRRTLVASFSVDGTTTKPARELAGAIGADLHEIAPAQRYSPADLNRNNRERRSGIEMNDKRFRPAAVANRAADMAQP